MYYSIQTIRIPVQVRTCAYPVKSYVTIPRKTAANITSPRLASCTLTAPTATAPNFYLQASTLATHPSPRLSPLRTHNPLPRHVQPPSHPPVSQHPSAPPSARLATSVRPAGPVRPATLRASIPAARSGQSHRSRFAHLAILRPDPPDVAPSSSATAGRVSLHPAATAHASVVHHAVLPTHALPAGIATPRSVHASRASSRFRPGPTAFQWDGSHGCNEQSH